MSHGVSGDRHARGRDEYLATESWPDAGGPRALPEPGLIAAVRAGSRPRWLGMIAATLSLMVLLLAGALPTRATAQTLMWAAPAHTLGWCSYAAAGLPRS